MADLRICLKAGAGFALVAGLSTVALADGGPDPFNPVAIASLPFSDTGDTTGGTDDFDAVCPFSGSTSPDEWYSWVSNGSGLIIDLCDSGYDTKVYVLDSGFNEVGCNDDACGSDGFRSSLSVLSTDAGFTYLIAVDGYGGSYGAYALSIEEFAGCDDVVCDPDAIDEGEACGDDTNGGCNASGTEFVPISGGDIVCGTAWADGGTRDTDWFSLEHGGGDLGWGGSAELPVVGFILTPGCSGIAVLAQGDNGGLCGDFEALLPGADAGAYSTWIGTAGAGGAGIFEGYPCADSNTYTATLSSVPPCPYDLDASGDVGFGDLLLILSNWGPCPM